MKTLFLFAALLSVLPCARASRNFDRNSDQYMRASTALVSSSPFTVAVWFRLTSNDFNNQYLFSAVNTSNSHGHALRFKGVGVKLEAISDAGTPAAATSTGLVSAGVWHHGCAVFAGDADRRVFLDGSRDDNTDSQAPAGIDTNNFGRYNSASDDLHGNLAEVGIWNVALTDEEVAALARGVSPAKIRPQSLVDYWPILGGGPGLELAVKGNALDVRGATTSELRPRTYGSVPIGDDAHVELWATRVNAASGSFTNSSKFVAQSSITKLRGSGYHQKFVYLLPLLGGNLAAARVPLVDTLNVGIATNNNMVDGDFSESLGLTGNGTNKSLDLLIKPSQLGTNTNGGLGFVLANIGATAGYALGIFTTTGGGRTFSLQLASTVERFWWGDGNGMAGTSSASIVAHYYGQRSSTNDRQLYRDGSLRASDSDLGVSVSGAVDANITLLNRNGDTAYSNHRCAAAYLTDGTLTAGEVAAFHTLIEDYLITPTGR